MIYYVQIEKLPIHCLRGRCLEDEKIMSAILGGRPRGFILELVNKLENSNGSTADIDYYGYNENILQGPNGHSLSLTPPII